MKKAIGVLGLVVLTAVIGLSIAGCVDPAIDPPIDDPPETPIVDPPKDDPPIDTPVFTAVTNITGVPSNKQTDIDLTLAGTAQPANATNQTIVWSIAADDDGSTGPILTGNALKTTTAGTVKVTATVTNGASETADYTQRFTINVTDVLPSFVAVSDITGVPAATTAGVDLILTGAVEPLDATNAAIVWSIATANSLLGATVTNGVLKTSTAGTAIVTATIVNGASATVNFTKNFNITVNAAPPAFVAVLNITGVQAAAIAGVDLTLTGAVIPPNATNKDIVWSIATTNTLVGATVANGVFRADTAGKATVTATVVNGASATTNYTLNLNITVSGSEAMSGKTAVEFFTDNNIKAGWNLGNSLDAVDGGRTLAIETGFGNPAVTQALFNGVKQSGFDIVRIPCTWIGHIGPAPDYTISEARLERVAEVVGYAKTAGIKAMIINIHHDGNNSQGNQTTWGFVDMPGAINNPTKKAEVQNQIAKMWTQIANYFKSYGDYLIFETLNEVHNGKWGYDENWQLTSLAYQKEQDILFDWNQAALNAIRATGGNNATRYVAVPGLGSTEPDIVVAANNRGKLLPNDGANGADKLIVSVHYYAPSDYTVADATVGQAQGGLIHEWGTPVEKNKLNHEMELLKTNFVDNGIAVYIGEWGAPTDVRRSMDSTIKNAHLDYIASVAKAARLHGVIPINWDDGGDFKMLERSNGLPQTGLWADVLDAMITAINTTTPLPPGGGGNTVIYTWNEFNDSDNGGTSTITLTEQPSGAISISGNVTTAYQHGFVGWEAVPDTAAKLQTATSISFKVIGDGKTYKIMLPTSSVTDYSYHFATFVASATETTITVNISSFVQPAWGNPQALDKSLLEKIQWQTNDGAIGTFSLTIRDLTLNN